MLVIGLAGGIASGKSTVARFFGQLGAVILDADRLGHEVLAQSVVVQAIESIWGPRVVINGQVDRQKLGQIVFGTENDSQQQLEQLEEITHPRINKEIRRRIAELRQASTTPAVVLDAPVMFKAGWDKQCDKIVFVQSTDQQRAHRANQRGWKPDELKRRESRQLSIEEKRKRSTDMIDNSKTAEHTFNQVCEIWQRWNLTIPRELGPTYQSF